MRGSTSLAGRARMGAAAAVALAVSAAAFAGEGTLPLIDFAAADARGRIGVNEPDNGECTHRLINHEGGKALEVTNRAGANAYPGVRIRPPAGAWDLSDFSRVEAEITNLGDEAISVAFRVDNAGDWRANPWNCENTSVQPGKTATAKVAFGYSWGKKGYKLDPAKVVSVLLFTGKPKNEIRFRVSALRAAGKAGERPEGVVERAKPKGGALVDFAAVDAGSLIDERGAKSALAGRGRGRHAVVTFTPDSRERQPGAFFSPPKGVMWDLSDYMQVEFTLSNPGRRPVDVICRVDNKGAGGTNRKCATARATLAPGRDATVIVPFASAEPWDGDVKDSGSGISSVDVIGAFVYTDRPAEEASLLVRGIKASNPRVRLPGWLGRRPPVEGDWRVTFKDEFDGTAVDETKWNYYGPNYWDRQSHWSKRNTIVGGGVVRLRYERRRGFHNDDPQGKDIKNLTGQKESDYAGGFLETYGKWTQLYGYFESRMKLPTAPGLWPAFWMMPDRGERVGPQWKRQSTHEGGMEFDIMEHLTRWGPTRYNVALHWDGYQKEHKHKGSSMVYVQPDGEGFVTCGLLWEPGLLVFYGNGIEIGRWGNPRVATVPGAMMFTMPQGGWDNSPLDHARLPADFVIDYVRVWQRHERM